MDSDSLENVERFEKIPGSHVVDQQLGSRPREEKGEGGEMGGNGEEGEGGDLAKIGAGLKTQLEVSIEFRHGPKVGFRVLKFWGKSNGKKFLARSIQGVQLGRNRTEAGRTMAHDILDRGLK